MKNTEEKKGKNI